MSAAVPAKPKRPELRPDNIPEALRALPRWVLWRYEWKPGKDGKPSGWTKVPYQRNQNEASTDNPATWCDFERALGACQAGGFDGVGFVVTAADEFVGIDLDHATEALGSPKPAVAKLLQQFDSYTERTPSGEGFRVWILGRKPEHANCKANDFDGAGSNLEVYETGRFFTVTGQRIAGAKEAIEPRQSALEALCAAHLTRAPRTPPRPREERRDGEGLSDAELLELARNAKSGEQFRALFDHGDTSGHNGDHSAADQALCNRLAYWTACDAEQMDRLFRASALMRDKWDRPARAGELYGEGTIREAIETCDNEYEPGGVGEVEIDLDAIRTASAQRHGGGAITTPGEQDHDDDEGDDDQPPAQPVQPKRKLLVGSNDHDQAARLFSAFHPDWRYTAAFGQWSYYDSARAIWEADEKLLQYTLIRDMIRAHAPAKMRRASEVNGVASLARSNAAAAMGVNDWDRDEWLLGTPGAVIDLRTGGPVPDPKACYVTRQTAVPLAPAGTLAPVWCGFLERITRHAPELVDYLQRIAGYALTGSDREQCLFFAFGGGGNGKGTFFNTLTAIMGSYSHTANNDLLLASNGDRHPTDMASLRGARLVTASELRTGARWDEQRLKNLTGGDPITARFMRQDFFTFMPQFTLVVFGNHRPSFSGVDEAIRRRVRLIPFSQTIPDGERDPKLMERLRAEYPAILRWMLDGCLAWQRDGLTTPGAVSEASAAYLEAEDSLGQWIADRIQRHPPGLRVLTPRPHLFNDWQAWAADNGGPNWSSKAFYLALEERGFTPGVSHGTRGFRDVSLNAAGASPVRDFASRR